MHSSLNSSQMAVQTSGIIRLRVLFGILKMSSRMANEAGPLRNRRVTWSRSLAGMAARMSVSLFEIRGSNLFVVQKIKKYVAINI